MSGVRWPVAGGQPVAGATELRLGDTSTTSPTTNIVAWARVPWSSNMNILMVWAWMLWSSDAVKPERYCALGMDALDIGRSQT